MPHNSMERMIFTREDALLPASLQLDTEPYIAGWRLVKNFDAVGLGRQISGAGWTFFCIAGEIQATAFGREEQDRVRSAVKRILAKLKSSEFNSLEISGVVSKRFLGVPCTNVHARSRHIQESVFLFRAKESRDWGQTRLAA